MSLRACVGISDSVYVCVCVCVCVCVFNINLGFDAVLKGMSRVVRSSAEHGFPPQ